jgi:hypothetical protein
MVLFQEYTLKELIYNIRSEISTISGEGPQRVNNVFRNFTSVRRTKISAIAVALLSTC